MKKTTLALIPLALIIFTVYLIIVDKEPVKTHNTNKEKPNEWFFKQRAFPIGEINHEVYITSLKQAKQLKKQGLLKDDTTIWEFAGPTNICGRITDVEMHPSDMETIYIGAASGGVFKTTNVGNSWDAIFDDALSLSIGDIAIAPSNHEIIYVH